MTFRRLLTQTATVIRRDSIGQVDEYGNPLPGPEARTDYPARLEQVNTREVLVDRETVTSEWRLFLPPEAVISAQDLVEVDGERFEVMGRPARESSPRGTHHVEALLRVVA